MNKPLCKVPRVVVAGLKGDSGKSVVSIGLIRTLFDSGLNVASFKKGPDFIDAAWLGAASHKTARNLDTFLMKRDVILRSFCRGAKDADIAVVEGNRGLFDGMDRVGSHSTAELAKIIGAPVFLVVEVTKTTRTVAALVKGCEALDPDLNLAGVILNRVGTERQEEVIRQAISLETGLPVVGAIPKLSGAHLPSRHLGLVTAMEHPDVSQALEEVGRVVASHVDIDAVREIARAESRGLLRPPDESVIPTGERSFRIGVFRDKAFSFYYPENLEALERRGARLVPISPIEAAELPEVDGIYAGGGFPEVHAKQLSKNLPFRADLKNKIDAGLPVWAECGGLMYLSETIRYDGHNYPMVGALPIRVEHTERPQGHGYVSGKVDRANPFLEDGTSVLGHEFHYSRLEPAHGEINTILALEKGRGVGHQRDGIFCGNVVAMYTHLHALSGPEWADGVLSAMAGETL